MIIKTKWQ